MRIQFLGILIFVSTLQDKNFFVPPPCDCPSTQPLEKGWKYYSHLGIYDSPESARVRMAELAGFEPTTVRVEVLRFHTEKFESALGCPAVDEVF